ncbi:hypothetical protein CVT24_001772 [Panaeolus cyanescens]|uniref:Uncharacterized protein n=1 Tax=Panaeolus cyanescens TaxID=181874 RepID=A0A409YU91_9AGAR|nr:hypothetical protein CVT24_001772 [Panaeolus cyanescens]
MVHIPHFPLSPADVAAFIGTPMFPSLTAYIYLDDSMSNPKHPNACGAALLTALLEFTKFIELVPRTKSGFSRLDDFWSTAYNFIITERTDEEFRQLKDGLHTCSCTFENNGPGEGKRELHEALRRSIIARDGSDRPVQTSDFISTLFGMLAAVLEFTTDVDLTPSGPDQVVKSLLQWQRFFGEVNSLTLVPPLIELKGLPMRNSLKKFDAVKLLVIQPIRNQVDDILHALTGESQPDTGTLLRLCCSVDPMAMPLWQCIELSLAEPVRSNQCFLNGSAMQVLQLLSIILYLLRVPVIFHELLGGVIRAQSLNRSLSDNAARIIRNFDMDKPGRQKMILHPAIVSAYRNQEVTSVPCDCGGCKDEEHQPGYEDYESIVNMLSKRYNGPQPCTIQVVKLAALQQIRIMDILNHIPSNPDEYANLPGSHPMFIPYVSLAYLQDSMANPKHPNACGTALCVAMMGFNKLAEPLPRIKGVISNLDNLWSSLYTFLIVERTDEEFLQLRNTLYNCSCTFENSEDGEKRKELHRRLRAGLIEEYGSDVPRNTTNFLSLVFSILTSVMEYTTNVSFAPFGTDQVVKSLLQWQRFFGGLTALVPIPPLLRMLGRPMRDSLIKFNAMKILVIEPIRAQLDEILDVITGKSNPDAKTLARVYSVFDPMAACLYQCVRPSFTEPVRHNQCLLNDSAMHALQLFSIMLYLIHEPAIFNELEGGATYAETLTKALASTSGCIIHSFDLAKVRRPNVLLHPAILPSYYLVRHRNPLIRRCDCGTCKDLEQQPGYDDYESIVKMLSRRLNGPEPMQIIRI